MKKEEIARLQEKADSLTPPYSHEDLKLIRTSFGFSQTDFARLLRIHRQTYVKWERDEQTQPSIADSAIQMLLHMRKHKSLIFWIDEC